MSRNLDRIFKVFGILVLAIVILGVASGVSLAPISIKRAEAQVGTITLSSSNLNPD